MWNSGDDVETPSTNQQPNSTETCMTQALTSTNRMPSPMATNVNNISSSSSSSSSSCANTRPQVYNDASVSLTESEYVRLVKWLRGVVIRVMVTRAMIGLRLVRIYHFQELVTWHISVIQHVCLTVSGVILKLFFSQFINIYSALKALRLHAI